MRSRLLTIGVVCFVLPALPAAAAKPAPATDPAPAPKAAGLVIAARTGIEDITTLNSTFRHARIAKETGHLPEITIIVYGRAIQVFDAEVSATAEARNEMTAAKAAGVRIVACKTAMEKFGLSAEVVSPFAEIVPSGMGELTRLVSLGHEVLSY